ncbi:MAG: DnaJ domain-containing protein [Pseudomonadota bacterium]
MGALVLGLGALIGLLLVAAWFVNADPKSVIRAARWAGIVIIVGLIIFLVAVGRWGLILPLLFFLLPLVRNFRTAFDRLRAAQGGSSGRVSSINTRFFRMTLDHDSGLMSGTVREGQFSGQPLDEMGEADLRNLASEVASDEQSAQVLEAYLDRRLGPDWRDGGEGTSRSSGQRPPRATAGGMSRDEAFAILGLEEGASDEDIRHAHKRLMLKVHPDQGGSDYLATKLNEAKDILLKG